MRATGLSIGAVLLANALACSDSDRLPAATPGPDAGGGPAEDVGTLEVGLADGPPPPDASGLCGNHFFAVQQTPPNLYFVLDRSGSMSDRAAGLSVSKYTAVRKACVNLIRALGARVNIGAAVFPGNPDKDQCGAGYEVFGTRRGDPLGLLDAGDYGPVTLAFATATHVTPNGGTPVASSLRALAPTLRALPGKTVVVLATDGGPNCNAEVACGASDCIWNIEKGEVYGTDCTETYNCCDPAIENGPGPNGCLDAGPTTLAVQELRDAGIRTYVVGIPGSGPYASLLDQLATVGGTARPTPPAYYRVDDMSTLEDTLGQIGERALVTCEFTLDTLPPDPGLVNVYLDSMLVVYDEENGWAWVSASALSLRGEACARLKRGEVGQVQVVAGCPTVGPR